MKTIFKIFAAIICIVLLFPITFSSCTDVGGDGIDSVLWEGSVNPQNTSYRNPVWEPSLEAGTVLKGASLYAAISATTQWASGLTYYCPALTSNDLMAWSKASSDAFTETTIPSWGGGGRVTSLSADFARYLSGNYKYWLFYTLEGVDGVGYANATSPQGLYNDFGQLELKGNPTGIKDPFFLVQTRNYYLCYTASDGVYIVKLTLSGSNGASIGSAVEPVKIANTNFGDVCINTEGSYIYIFGVVNNEIHYARSTDVEGPYVDKSGVSLTEGSTGETVIVPGPDYSEVKNPMRAFLDLSEEHIYLLYNATLAEKPTLESGYAREPLYMQPLELTEDEWFATTYAPADGWTTPRFE